MVSDQVSVLRDSHDTEMWPPWNAAGGRTPLLPSSPRPLAKSAVHSCFEGGGMPRSPVMATRGAKVTAELAAKAWQLSLFLRKGGGPSRLAGSTGLGGNLSEGPKASEATSRP